MFKCLFKNKSTKINNDNQIILNKMSENCAGMLKIAEELPESEEKQRIIVALKKQEKEIKNFKK